MIQDIQNEKNKNIDVRERVNQGDLSGLETLFSQGNYEDCLNLAAKQSGEVLNQYLERYTKMLLQNGEYKKAGDTLIKHACPQAQELLPIYKTLALEILAVCKENELQTLRDMLQRLCDNLALSLDENNPIYREFYEYLFITHLLLMKTECSRNPSLSRIHAKQCISLLRYTKFIRADKAFLDSAHACKSESLNNMAFVFYNRYLDLAEAIEDPNSAQIDNTEFEGTDIPSPYDIPLPEGNLTNDDQREEIRDWVLTIQMDDNVQKTLSKRRDDESGQDIYEAALFSPFSNASWQPCIISGYPLLREHMITCKFCGKGAIREYWNEYIEANQNCPWCKTIQTQY